MGAKRVKPERNAAAAKAKPKDLPQEGLLGFKEWLELHQQKLTVIVASLFVVLLVAWGVNAFLDRKERSAESEYAAILKEWPSGDTADAAVWQGLQGKLEKFIAEAGTTRAGLYARMDLMRVLLQEKRFDEAVRIANELVSRAGDKEIGPLLRYQLALTFDRGGKPDEALAQWSALKAAPLPGVEREVDWRLGRHYAAKQEFAKAVEHYESALKHPGDYPGAALLQEDLAMAKSKMPKGS